MGAPLPTLKIKMKIPNVAKVRMLSCGMGLAVSGLVGALPAPDGASADVSPSRETLPERPPAESAEARFREKIQAERAAEKAAYQAKYEREEKAAAAAAAAKAAAEAAAAEAAAAQ